MPTDAEFDVACAHALMAPALAVQGATFSVATQIMGAQLRQAKAELESERISAQGWKLRALYAEKRLREMALGR